MDYVEDIISDEDWNFVGYAEEVSTICWRNDQTHSSSRGSAGEADIHCSRKLMRFCMGCSLAKTVHVDSYNFDDI